MYNLVPYLVRDDLVSAACEGFLDALDRFSPDLGVQFKTYAEYRVHGAILDEIRRSDWRSTQQKRRKKKVLESARNSFEREHGRGADCVDMITNLKMVPEEYFKLERSATNYIAVDVDFLLDKGHEHPVSKEPSPLKLVHSKQMAMMLGKLIDRVLNDQERLVITLYYYEDLSMREISHVLGVTESRVSQLHTMAIRKLKEKLRRYKR